MLTLALTLATTLAIAIVRCQVVDHDDVDAEEHDEFRKEMRILASVHDHP